jgi:hypothetical protein
MVVEPCDSYPAEQEMKLPPIGEHDISTMVSGLLP